MGQIWLAFITGLTTGGFSCFAVQGGLLTTSLQSDEGVKVTKEMRKRELLLFLLAKLIAYTALGFLLGYLGSSLFISPKIQGWLQLMIGFFMLATVGRLLELHPIFRYFVIQPPKSVMRLLRNRSKVKTALTPLVLGALTVLIPCGVTQAMMLYAIGTSSPLWGAGVMFAFTLGTTPVFYAIAMAAITLLKNKLFTYASATFIAVIGILSINSGQILRASPHTLQNYWAVITKNEEQASVASAKNGVQEVTINVSNSGYKADVNTLKVGVPVKLKLITNNVKSCSRAFTIPDFDYFKILPENGTEMVEFTPEKTGKLAYTCSMGMYGGSFNVIP